MKKFVVLLMLFTSLLCKADTADILRISPKDKTIVILIPQQAGPGITLAAEELVLHINKATGVAPVIQRGGNIPAGKFIISLGNTDFARQHGISAENLKHNQANVSASPDYLIINGREENAANRQALLIRTSGTLFTVYDILHIRKRGIKGAFIIFPIIINRFNILRINVLGGITFALGGYGIESDHGIIELESDK
jgi:hypothetical protein